MAKTNVRKTSSIERTVFTVNFYRGTDGDWRWNVRASNGRIVADSSEGYRNLADCEEMAHKILTHDGSVLFAQ